MVLRLDKPGEVRDFEGWGSVGAFVVPIPTYCRAPSGSYYERQEYHCKGIVADPSELCRKEHYQIGAKSIHKQNVDELNFALFYNLFHQCMIVNC